jgi:hypothetical protein
MRIPQVKAARGSLRWMQEFCASASNPIERAIREALTLDEQVGLDWRSPNASDDYAEYRDATFLRQVGLSRLEANLASFWPPLGPQWDGLAVTADDKVLLVEAKAHLGELVSSCAAGAKSLDMIERSFALAKRYYGASTDSDWTTAFYQYANRLAHLYFLRQHGVDAHLVFIYFINDSDMRGPTSRAEWAPVLDDCYRALGLEREQRIPGVHSVFIDVAKARSDELSSRT